MAYGSWRATAPSSRRGDDHDFGASDGEANATLEGKKHVRKAFIEYRAHGEFGDGENGIYGSFRRGPIEIFVLDTRYFANDNGADGKAAYLGESQWRWLEEALLVSTAPVKVLASGAIYYDGPAEKEDCWANFPDERAKLFQLIGDHGINGVVLVSGDLHQSRIIEHQTEPVTGYSIYEFVASPIHEDVEPELNTPHPGLIKHLNAPHVFLQLEVDTVSDSGTVTGRFINGKGELLHEEVLALALLQKGD